MPPQPLRVNFSEPLQAVRVVPGLKSTSPTTVSGISSLAVGELEKAAYERGRRDAEKSLQEQLIQQRAELATLQHGALRAVKDSISQVVQQSEALLVDLALEVACRLVSELPINREMVAANVREALNQIEGTSEITLQLHPEDLSLFEQIDTLDRPGAPGVESIKLQPNPAVTRGGCLVHTRFGVIDNQRETKLRNLKQTLAA